MRLTTKQLRALIAEALAEDATPQPSLEQVKAAEQKAIEAYRLLPRDFAPGVMLKSAIMGIVNARKQLETKHVSEGDLSAGLARSLGRTVVTGPEKDSGPGMPPEFHEPGDDDTE